MKKFIRIVLYSLGMLILLLGIYLVVIYFHSKSMLKYDDEIKRIEKAKKIIPLEAKRIIDSVERANTNIQHNLSK